MRAMKRFEEIPHTADWSFRAFGNDLKELFENAAYAMFEMEGIHADAMIPEVVRIISVHGFDPESLLVNWLSELIYLQESFQEGYYYFLVELLPRSTLRAQIRGQPLIDVGKIIKAVTYHNLEIKQTKEGWEAVVVVDV
jgi:SHS2 domain-containing protein